MLCCWSAPSNKISPSLCWALISSRKLHISPEVSISVKLLFAFRHPHKGCSSQNTERLTKLSLSLSLSPHAPPRLLPMSQARLVVVGSCLNLALSRTHTHTYMQTDTHGHGYTPTYTHAPKMLCLPPLDPNSTQPNLITQGHFRTQVK